MFIRSIAFASLAATAAGKNIRFQGGEERNLQNGQPSTKFAASWSSDVEIAAACINGDNEFNQDFWGTSNLVDIDALCDGLSDMGSASSDLTLSQLSPLGKIKIPQNKEILVTLSSQIDILTVNQATSKKPGRNGGDTDVYYGNIGGTSAMAGVTVEIIAKDSSGDMTQCLPGIVTMASREVELKNVIGGEVTYEDCTIAAEGEDPVCVIKVADTELESSIGLAMSTAAAHSFQFLCVDMDSDTYDIYAKFSLDAAVQDLCDGGDLAGVATGDCADIADFAAARVALKNRMLTVQQVRMANQIVLD